MHRRSSVNHLLRPCLMRRLVMAIVGGLVLTVAGVLSGAARVSGWSLMFGVDDVPAEEHDRTYFVGWVDLPSGEVRRYDCVRPDDPNDPNAVEYDRHIRGAKVAGRPLQWVTYFHRQRGFPFLCVEYFWNVDGPHGVHYAVNPDRLEYYPQYRFRSILWAGLCGDVGVWSGLVFIMISTPFVFRILYRRKRGLCIECGYQLRGLIEHRCPECGRPFRPRVLKMRNGSAGNEAM